jgi:SAM-dependent methyltransferase
VPLLPDYSNQARGYDQTRGVSRSMLGPLREALAGAPGPKLADVGGGTGNYARALVAEGWEPVVADPSPGMREQAAAKGLPTVDARAEALPFADASFDAAMLVSMLHHTADPARALAEARRILRPAGRLAVIVFSREDHHHPIFTDYFAVCWPWMAASHPPRAELLAALPGASSAAIEMRDMADASMAALCGRPDLILQERYRTQTSFFERMARDHPDELAAGLDRLRADVEAGRAPTDPGVATLITWTAPAAPSP